MKTVVALTCDIQEQHFRRGQAGTIVEILAPGVVEVKFSDLDEIPTPCARYRKAA